MDEAQDALTQALTRYAQTIHGDRILTGYELVYTTVALDEDMGAARYDRVAMSGQPFHVSLGLHDIGQMLLQDSWHDE